MRTEATALAGIPESPGMAEIYTYYVLGRYFVGTECGSMGWRWRLWVLKGRTIAPPLECWPLPLECQPRPPSPTGMSVPSQFRKKKIRTFIDLAVQGLGLPRWR